MPSYVRLTVQTEHRMAVHQRCESIVLNHSIWHWTINQAERERDVNSLSAALSGTTTHAEYILTFALQVTEVSETY